MVNRQNTIWKVQQIIHRTRGSRKFAKMKERLQKTSTTTKTSDMGNIHKEIIIDNRIFLKGFHVDTKEEDLENIFKTYGAIVETKIIRDTFTGQNRGFGFITFDSQQVAQDVLSSVKSVQLDDVEVTVGPAKIRRNPPIKPFRYNQYSGTTYDSQQTNQYMTLPYTASPEGFFTFYPPQAPYYPTAAPYQQQQQLKMPCMQEPGVMMETQNSDTRIPVEQNSEGTSGNNTVFKSENSSSHIVNSSAKIESSVVLAVSSNVPAVTTSKISNDINKPSAGYPVQTNDISTSVQQPPPPTTPHQFINNGYVSSSMAPPHTVPPPINAEHHQYVNINQPMPTSNVNEQQMKITNGVPYTTTNLAYENGGPPLPNINGIDLALITNGIGNMMPTSFQYIPMATFYPPNTTTTIGDQQQHANYFYKPENFAPSTNPTEHPHSTHYQNPIKSTNNNRPCITKIGNKITKECSPCSPNTPENVPATLKAQNFVFMSTGPGKVNRVVVH